MEARNLRYSMKNIPFPPKQRYLKNMMEKVQNVIAKLRQKAHFLDTKKRTVNKINFIGFKFNFKPTHHELLSTFENDLYDIIRSINFKPVRNYFGKKTRRRYK